MENQEAHLLSGQTGRPRPCIQCGKPLPFKKYRRVLSKYCGPVCSKLAYKEMRSTPNRITHESALEAKWRAKNCPPKKEKKRAPKEKWGSTLDRHIDAINKAIRDGW